MSQKEYEERARKLDFDWIQFLKDTVSNEQEFEQDLEAFQGLLDREFGPLVKELRKDLGLLDNEVKDLRKEWGPVMGEAAEGARNTIAPVVEGAMQQMQGKSGAIGGEEIQELKRRAGDLVEQLRNMF